MQPICIWFILKLTMLTSLKRLLITMLALVAFLMVNAQTVFHLVKEANITTLQANLDLNTINAKDAYGQTPLMYAAAVNSDPAVIRLLIDAGADLQARTYASWTALMYAVRDNPNPQVALTLLNFGADPLARNASGQRAIDLAELNDSFVNSDVFVTLQALSSIPSQANNAPSTLTPGPTTASCHPSRANLMAYLEGSLVPSMAARLASLGNSVRDVSWAYSDPEVAISGQEASLNATWAGSATVSDEYLAMNGNIQASFAFEDCQWHVLDYLLTY